MVWLPVVHTSSRIRTIRFGFLMWMEVMKLKKLKLVLAFVIFAQMLL